MREAARDGVESEAQRMSQENAEAAKIEKPHGARDEPERTREPSPSRPATPASDVPKKVYDDAIAEAVEDIQG